MPIFGNIIKRGLVVTKKLEKRQDNIAAIVHQKRTLMRLLRKANHTSFGQYYDFKTILKANDPIRAFQGNVPVFDYNSMYDAWWHMTLKSVEDVCWPGAVKYFALSSGTSGAASKHIPITEDMQRSMRKAGLKMFFALSNFDIDPQLFTKGMLMLGGTSSLKDQGGYFAGDLSGINASKPPFWLRPYYKPGTKISRINSWDARIEQIVKKAPEWDIGFIVGIPSWLQLMMERIIEHYKLETIHDIWPNLSVCVHGGIHFEPYKKSFETVLAHPLIYMDSYLASEGFVAYQDRPETKAMKLLLGNGIFYEFIPFRDEYFDEEGNLQGDPEVLSIEEVEEGKNYALLISTCSGAWRYLIGDTVKFTDKARSEILITGRTKHYLSICGEHLSIDNMNAAIRKAQEALQTVIPEYTVSAIEADRHFRHRWYVGCDPLVDPDALKTVIDETLKVVNDDYLTERENVLQDIQVIPIPPDLFYDYQRRQGKMGGQNKFPRVLKGDKFAEWEAFVRERHSVADSSNNEHII